MATVSTEFNDKICQICAPKQTIAITSCHGCQCHFCRKHFNEHRDQLSRCLNTIVDLHDQILQDLNTRIDHTPREQLNNDETKKLLQQIDEWETATIDACPRAADKTRDTVKQLFDKTEENNSLTERLSLVAKELEEQQQIENFVERDLDRWRKQLGELKNDINQPIQFPTDIIIQRQDIDWEQTIKISRAANCDESVEHYVLILGEKGVGKTTFIHYAANFIENKNSFEDRISQARLEPNQKEVVVYSNNSKKRLLLNRYSFPIDDQNSLVFLDPLSYIGDENIDIVDSLNHLYKINRFASIVYIYDGTDIEEDPDWENLTDRLLEVSENFRECVDVFKQVSIVFTNCSLHALNVDYSILSAADNVNFYFMQNSAYQLFRADSTTESIETDFSNAMETMEQIIQKIINKIYHQE